jgi:N-acetylneuraminic acid mutarotase
LGGATEPYARTAAAAAAAVVGYKLVLVGGQNEKKLVPQTEVFDGKSWTDAAALPTPREHPAAVSDGFYVYTVGGRFLSTDKNSAAFERFDPESGEWVKLVDMPTPRGSYRATFIDGRVVVVGGEEPTRVLGTVEMYDVAEGKWISLPPMPTPRHGEVVATVGNTVYVIGGANRPAMKEVSRRSGPWTSPNACDSPPSHPLAVQTITTSPAPHFRSVLTLREYRCRAAWRG